VRGEGKSPDRNLRIETESCEKKHKNQKGVLEALDSNRAVT
jgi:hypothetical protein